MRSLTVKRCWPARLALLTAASASILVAAASPALAAQPGHGGRGSTSTPTGNDVSYPQCGGSLPSKPAFGIVGLNGGLANDLNPCFGPSASYRSYTESELYWAVAATTGGTSQPKASIYVNTADPGGFYGGAPIADWPISGSTPLGTCTTMTVTSGGTTYTVGASSPACAWQYGYQKAAQDTTWLSDAAAAIDGQGPRVQVTGSASSYPWWLDVETGNTWQGGASGQAMNSADLQGMVAALREAGAPAVGVYSTSSQWDQITGGTTGASGSLVGLPDWIPGARRLSGAVSDCSDSSFTLGSVTVTQWFANPDGDYAC